MDPHPGTSRRPSLTRFGSNVTTATIATNTNNGGNGNAFASQPTETDKLLDQHQINMQLDQQAISSV